jgi:hypothetical protein
MLWDELYRLILIFAGRAAQHCAMLINREWHKAGVALLRNSEHPPTKPFCYSLAESACVEGHSALLDYAIDLHGSVTFIDYHLACVAVEHGHQILALQLEWRLGDPKFLFVCDEKYCKHRQENVYLCAGRGGNRETIEWILAATLCEHHPRLVMEGILHSGNLVLIKEYQNIVSKREFFSLGAYIKDLNVYRSLFESQSIIFSLEYWYDHLVNHIKDGNAEIACWLLDMEVFCTSLLKNIYEVVIKAKNILVLAHLRKLDSRWHKNARWYIMMNADKELLQWYIENGGKIDPVRWLKTLVYGALWTDAVDNNLADCFGYLCSLTKWRKRWLVNAIVKEKKLILLREADRAGFEVTTEDYQQCWT